MARVTDIGGRAVSGQVPFAVVAIVVDNVDPDGLGRIKVKYPTLPGEPTSFWLRQVSSNAGSGGGLYALPEKDDEVLVVFLQGSQDHGIIVGQFWNGTTKPPTEAPGEGMPGPGKTDTGGRASRDAFQDGSKDTKKNDRRFWRSRSGHLIAMDDTSGKETLQIWDGSRTLSVSFDTADKRIVIANTQGDINLRTKQDFIFEAGRDIKFRAGRDIFGESAQKTTLKIGTEFRTESGTLSHLKSGTDFKIEAGTNLKATAQVNVQVEGVMFAAKGSATAKVEGGAAVTVRGGMVSIN